MLGQSSVLSSELLARRLSDTEQAVLRKGLNFAPAPSTYQDTSIRFTVEMESDGQLPFLDVLLRHDPDGSISTSVYRKPTHTDRYLDFSSHHPLAHKIAVVRTLHTRAESINSSVLGKDKETKHLRQALTSNGYPKAVMHRHSMQSNPRTVD